MTIVKIICRRCGHSFKTWTGYDSVPKLCLDCCFRTRFIDKPKVSNVIYVDFSKKKK